ncbi:MAG: hypothetical protein DRM99_04015 [Thermoplasmata archaeon]|nr:MAG: hypothetical protein DRM99_04015 [Thermoplasmata archaeon]RLF50384.1 MAG: hypothetical protein DRN24_06625 [Thermoplasmata archaeon]
MNFFIFKYANILTLTHYFYFIIYIYFAIYNFNSITEGIQIGCYIKNEIVNLTTFSEYLILMFYAKLDLS